MFSRTLLFRAPASSSSSSRSAMTAMKSSSSSSSTNSLQSNSRSGASGGGGGGALSRASSQSVLDTFLQIQLGTWTPSPQTARQVLVTHFGAKLMQMQLSEAKLAAMDPKRVTKLLKQTLYEQYLAVPFTVLSFDLEFTGIPNFSGDVTSLGPSEDIVEIALYDPDQKRLFEQLVVPYHGRPMSNTAASMTGISDKDLKTKGKPLVDAWNSAVDFIEATMKYNTDQRRAQFLAENAILSQQRASIANPFSFDMETNAKMQELEQERLNSPNPGSGDGFKHEQAERLLLLSHGARLVDIAMINWVQTLEGAKQLPATTTFGDTLLQIKDLHRRRPVTKDKWPAAWSLEDIAAFLSLKVDSIHRAGSDAVLTWEALYHSLDRYGDESLTPRQQLVGRFFDQEAKGVLNAYDEEQQQRVKVAQMSKSTKKVGLEGFSI